MMNRKFVFAGLYVAVFVFPLIPNISGVDAQGLG